MFDIFFTDLGNMHQSVLMNSDIYKSTEINNITNRSLQDHSFFQVFHIKDICAKYRSRHFLSWITSRFFQFLYDIPKSNLSYPKLFCQLFAVFDFTGKVELAQLRYRASRLVGLGASLSRLGGGIGTRGPGEKKLESDRRLIRKRITALKEELSQVEKHRELLRTGRTRGKMKTAAIVGYTNAGKSTLLNTLTGAGVLSEDKLFATLDPTTRALTLDDGQQILLTDTVGFIRKLPHNLVEAFKSTLEEARYADYIIHVVDCSNPQAVQQMEVVYDTLQELEVQGKKTITLFNKVDMGAAIRMRDSNADHTLKVSAKTGEGLEDLKALLGKILSEEQIYVEKLFTYQEAGKIQLIREYGQLLSEEYTDTGILVKARVPQEIHGKLM